MERKINFLEEMGYIQPDGLSLKGEFAASIFGYELLLSQMHHDGFLNKLNLTELCILLAALIYEPRKGDKPARLSHDIERLRVETEQYWRFIHRQENKFHLYPYTKPPYFHLAPAVEAWVQGSSFKKAVESIEIDEGELVRCFRMIIQLLRELAYSSHATEELKLTANRARQIMNRDVIDAEKQLRA